MHAEAIGIHNPTRKSNQTVRTKTMYTWTLIRIESTTRDQRCMPLLDSVTRARQTMRVNMFAESVSAVHHGRSRLACLAPKLRIAK